MRRTRQEAKRWLYPCPLSRVPCPLSLCPVSVAALGSVLVLPCPGVHACGFVFWCRQAAYSYNATVARRLCLTFATCRTSKAILYPKRTHFYDVTRWLHKTGNGKGTVRFSGISVARFLLFSCPDVN